MAAGGESTTGARETRRVHDMLPRSGAIIEAFTNTMTVGHPGQLVLDVAHDLASHHQQQWQAEEVSRVATSADEVATSKRRIDDLNAERVALVERIDGWAAREIPSRPEASLHTETLGSVVDRLAIAWVRANILINMTGRRDAARAALRQQAELANAYDDLIGDVAAGRRRLPAWRQLKIYRSGR